MNEIRKNEVRVAPAFTLVEMLVVIAIIAILAALLLTALSRSKASAQQTQCLGQTKQLALALQMSTQDNADSMPWPNWGRRFQGWLYTPVFGQPPEPSNPQKAVKGYWMRKYACAFVAGTEILCCRLVNSTLLPSCQFVEVRLVLKAI
jgi:prepilin-type N-terminal cleavage/methylation domain-containing protein